jgi:outer membrane protein TolC
MKLALAAALFAAALPARAADAPLPVSLHDAITAAVGSRLDAITAGEHTAQEKARARQTAAAILPQITGTLSQSRTFKENLAAQGLSFPGFPSQLGPFDTFDARARLTQKLFDWGAWRRTQSGQASARAASAEESAAREQVASAAALSYLEALRAQRAVAAARADKAVADSLLSLARDRKEQGAATGVDVVRAQARGADADAALLRAQVTEREALLLLKRVTGWPFERELRLTDDFAAAGSTVPALDATLSAALAGRAEIAAAEERVKADDLAAKAVFGDRLPTVVIGGEYARSGTVPGDATTASSVGGAVSLPIFGGGLLTARQDEADSRRREGLAALTDARRQVELDVRTALERLSESAEEERAAELSLSLAERELSMAQDRYAAGLGASVDVVEAQAELARARSSQVSALSRYHSSRVNLAAAVGRASDFTL